MHNYAWLCWSSEIRATAGDRSWLMHPQRRAHMGTIHEICSQRTTQAVMKGAREQAPFHTDILILPMIPSIHNCVLYLLIQSLVFFSGVGSKIESSYGGAELPVDLGNSPRNQASSTMKL